MTRKQTLDEKQEEKTRLWRAYREAKRNEWSALLAREPRLGVFRTEIARQKTPAAMIRFVAESWARKADDNIRFAALHECARHCDKMLRAQGGFELDDPIPPARSAFFIAKEMLAVR